MLLISGALSTGNVADCRSCELGTELLGLRLHPFFSDSLPGLPVVCSCLLVGMRGLTVHGGHTNTKCREKAAENVDADKSSTSLNRTPPTVSYWVVGFREIGHHGAGAITLL